MKARLNLTIDETVLSYVKIYAESKKISVSELVEQYFRDISKLSKPSNIIDLVERLDPPQLNQDMDLKKGFYEDQADKYGF